MQVIPKRLAVWLLETLSEAVLLSVLLFVLGGRGPAGDFLFILMGTIVVFMWGYGYLFTTAIFGVVWRGRRWWLYPSSAAVLFLTHLHFYATGWASSLRLLTQVFGACIVFACTVAGNWLLRR